MNDKITLHDKPFRVMIPAEEIDRAVSRIAEQLNERFADRVPVMLGVLSGSYMFLSDLARKTTFNSELAFVKLSSYQGTESTGQVSKQFEVDMDVVGRDIIIVEDIVETGHSMNYLLSLLREKRPASITICTLFFKPEKFLYDFKVDYVALSIGNEFIVGYGLDYNQLGRNLKDIYVIDE